MKKGDRLLLGLFLAVSVLASAMYFTKRERQGLIAQAALDGAVIAEIPMDLANGGSLGKLQKFSSAYGFNVVEVSDGAARISSSDCRGADCIRRGWLDQAGDAAVCLPHRFSLRIIKKGAASDTDAVSF